MRKKEITIKVIERDYNLLQKYGFMFEKNISQYIHEIAEQMRQAIEEERNSKNYD